MKIGDRVRVTAGGSDRCGLVGVVREVRGTGEWAMLVVKLDAGGEHIGHAGTVQLIARK